MKLKPRRFLLTILLSSSMLIGLVLSQVKLQAASPDDIVINEIGAYESSNHEWIEIFNKGASQVDLTSWKFYENGTNHSLTLYQGSDLIIEPGEYAIIADVAANFVADYPGFAGTVIDSSWTTLSESGELIELRTSTEPASAVESFTYISAPDFSLERANPGLNDYSSTNWQEHASGNTAGEQNSNYSGGAEPVCGNNEVEGDEGCDDGNTLDGDGCSATCITEYCGDNIVNNTDEACDGNSEACTIAGYAGSHECNPNCNGWEECITGEYCGDNIVNGWEECDDGNTGDEDGCSSICETEVPAEPVCGNNILEQDEECDDGNTEDGDGCTSDCMIEVIPEPVCGNSIVEGDEECDDGNTDDGDGCTSDCMIEVIPEPVCGNSIVAGEEECDDGNTEDGDGCSALCIIEQIELTPRAIKEAVKENLENSKTGDHWLDKKIDKVLRHINKSLNNRFWLNETHLKPRNGIKVFYAEYKAVQLTQQFLCVSGHEGKHCYKNSKKNKLSEEVKAAFEQAIKDLVQADKILAEIALAEAKATGVNNLRYQRKYNRWIRRAEAKMNRALQYVEIDPDIAMDQFDQAWQFAQEAIEVANY